MARLVSTWIHCEDGALIRPPFRHPARMVIVEAASCSAFLSFLSPHPFLVDSLHLSGASGPRYATCDGHSCVQRGHACNVQPSSTSWGNGTFARLQATGGPRSALRIAAKARRYARRAADSAAFKILHDRQDNLRTVVYKILPCFGGSIWAFGRENRYGKIDRDIRGRSRARIQRMRCPLGAAAGTSNESFSGFRTLLRGASPAEQMAERGVQTRPEIGLDAEFLTCADRRFRSSKFPADISRNSPCMRHDGSPACELPEEVSLLGPGISGRGAFSQGESAVRVAAVLAGFVHELAATNLRLILRAQREGASS
ncbi:hypothetical protein VTO73DRAFT_9746 [Trametes versicolor]